MIQNPAIQGGGGEPETVTITIDGKYYDVGADFIASGCNENGDITTIKYNSDGVGHKVSVLKNSVCFFHRTAPGPSKVVVNITGDAEILYKIEDYGKAYCVFSPHADCVVV